MLVYIGFVANRNFRFAVFRQDRYVIACRRLPKSVCIFPEEDFQIVVETVHVLPKEERLKCSIFEMEIPTGCKSYKTSATFFYFTGSF